MILDIVLVLIGRTPAVQRILTRLLRIKTFQTFPICNSMNCGAEMQDLRWFSLEEAFSLDLPNVTRFILTEVQTRLQSPDQPHSPAFLRWGRTGPLMDRL